MIPIAFVSTVHNLKIVSMSYHMKFLYYIFPNIQKVTRNNIDSTLFNFFYFNKCQWFLNECVKKFPIVKSDSKFVDARS